MHAHLGGCCSSLACIPLPLLISCMEGMTPGVKIMDMESSPWKQDMGRGWTLPLRVGRKRNRKRDHVDGGLSTWDRNWHVPEDGMIREKDSLLSKTSKPWFKRTLSQEVTSRSSFWKKKVSKSQLQCLPSVIKRSEYSTEASGRVPQTRGFLNRSLWSS